MSTYYATAKTNYFKVTDEDKYRELFAGLSAEDGLCDLTVVKNGEKLHCFGAYSSIDYYRPSEDGDEPEWADIDGFGEDIQQILPEGEAFIYTEIGYEKLISLSAYAMVVTRKTIEFTDIFSVTAKMARNALGDPEWLPVISPSGATADVN